MAVGSQQQQAQHSVSANTPDTSSLNGDSDQNVISTNSEKQDRNNSNDVSRSSRDEGEPSKPAEKGGLVLLMTVVALALSMFLVSQMIEFPL